MKQESLARKLQLLRAERGLTLVQASALTGVTRGTLSELESGKRVAYMPTLSKIAEGYGVDVRELLLEEPVPLAEAWQDRERTPEEVAESYADLPRRREDAAVITQWRIVGGELRPVMFWNIPPEEREPHRARFRQLFPEGFEERELTEQVVAELAVSVS